MVTAVDRPRTEQPPDTPAPAGGAHRMVLTGISWATYERLVDDYADRAGPRFTFDRGTLEIMSPTVPHDTMNRHLAYIVTIVAAQLGIPNLDAGSVTVRQRKKERGFEADSTFYFTNIALIESLTTTVDLAVHPPPDLVIEVDATNSSLRKLPLFAALKIPEVWRVEDGAVLIYVLRDGAYVRASTSMALKVLTDEILNRLLAERTKLGSAAWFQRVLRWAQEQAKQP